MQIHSAYSGSNLIYGPNKMMKPKPSNNADRGEAAGRELDLLSGSKANAAAARLMIPNQGGTSDLATQERDVLSREQALKAAAAGGTTTTTYTYKTGPDGKRYIVGAEVTVTGDADVVDSVAGGAKSAKRNGLETSSEPGVNLETPQDKADANEESIARLEQTEREVIAHEAAHQAAAGRFGGPVSYTYTTGPDGRRYITGGEVPISTPATNDPEEALRNASQVMRAAMAPGDPSGQDIAVAASAAQTAASARAKLAEGKSDTQDLPQGRADAVHKKATEAYSSQRSPKGLWTASNSYEETAPPVPILEPGETDFNEKHNDRNFEIAA